MTALKLDNHRVSSKHFRLTSVFGVLKTQKLCIYKSNHFKIDLFESLQNISSSSSTKCKIVIAAR